MKTKKMISCFVEKVNEYKEGYALFYIHEGKFCRREGKKRTGVSDVTMALYRDEKEVFSYAWTENDTIEPNNLFYIIKGCKKVVLCVDGDEPIEFVHDKDSTENACLTIAYKYSGITYLIIAKQGKRLLILSDIEADEENKDGFDILKSIIQKEEPQKQSDSEDLCVGEVVLYEE